MLDRRLITVLNVALVAALATPVAVLADGKVFSTATARVNIPEQSAVICFDGRTERLIIETAYEGEGEDFAWVVPLPAKPQAIEKASKGLFPTLRMVCRPHVVQRTWWNRQRLVFIYFFAATVWLAVFAFRSKLAVALLIGAWAVGPLIWEEHIAEELWLGTRATKAAAGRGPVSGVTLHEERRVGAYRVATLSATDTRALLDWLNASGYKVDSAVEPVLADYVRDGWMFVAARLNEDLSGRKENLTHPLSFTFPTDRAVYPLRLTGVGNGRLTIDLYVFSEEEPVAPPFRRERVGRLDWETDSDYIFGWRYFDELPIHHPALTDVTKSYIHGAKLTASLAPSQMEKDLYVSWRNPRPYRRVLYTRDVLSALCAGTGALVFLGAGFLCVVWAAVGTRRVRVFRDIRLGALAAASLGLGAIFFMVLVYALPPVGTQPHLRVWLIGGAAVCLALALIAARALTSRITIPVTSQLYFVGILMFPVALWVRLGSIYLHVAGAAIALALVVLGLAARQGPGKPPRRLHARRAVTFLVLALALVFLLEGVLVAILGQRTADTVNGGGRSEQSTYGDLQDILEKEGERTGEDLLSCPLPVLRERVGHVCKSNSGMLRNPFTDEPLREEDSPGNYTIEEVDGKPAFFYYDINGAKVEARWSKRAREKGRQ